MLGLVYHSYNLNVMVEIYERNPKIMDDGNVNLVVQELQKKNNPDYTKIVIHVDKQDNDGIEGDANFDIYHDDVDWCE